MLKVSVSSLAAQFLQKRIPYETFVLSQLRFRKFQIHVGTFRVSWQVGLDYIEAGGSQQPVVDKQTKMLWLLTTPLGFCAVPENIRTPPIEGFCLAPHPPRKFRFSFILFF